MSWFKKLWGEAFPRDEVVERPVFVPVAGPGLLPIPGSSRGEKWDRGLSGGASGVTIDNDRARKSARMAYLDSLQAHALVHRFADSVVDVGLKPKPSPVASLLGITQDKADDWAQDVERRFHLWAQSKNSHRAEEMSLYQLQRLAMVCQQRDGEYFLRVFYDREKGIQLRFIDPASVQGWSATPTDGRSWVLDGIERDSRGRAVAYNLIVTDPSDGAVIEQRIPARGKRSGRPMMLHGFQSDWPDQVRGYPRFFHALQEFQNLTDFTLAQIKKAIIQSSITMFNKPSKTADATNPFLDISQEGASPLDSLYSVPGSPPSQPLQSRLEDRVRYIPISDAAFGAPGSVGVFGLGAGEELVPMPNTAPAEGFVGFVNSFTTHLAASVGIPAEVLLMKFDQSYSAARGALIMFWRTAQIWRNELVTDFLQPVYEEWLSNEIAQGRIRARGWSNKNMRAAWCLCSWSGVPMPNIDPMKTAKADQLYIEMGAQTLQDVAHNLNGSNAEDNMNRLKREFGKLPEPPWNKKPGTPGPDPLPGSDEELK